MEFGLFAIALEFPSTDVAEVFVVTLCFAFFGLAFFTEVTAARFFTVEGVEGEDFCEFKEVSQTASTFQVLVEGTFEAISLLRFCTAVRYSLCLLSRFSSQGLNPQALNLSSPISLRV